MSGSDIKTINAANSFSNGMPIYGKFNFSLSGTWVATVYLQRSFNNGIAWLDVGSYTANCELVGEEPEVGVTYRFGTKVGGYTSGAIVGRISQ